MAKKISIAVLAFFALIFLAYFNAVNINTKQFKITEETLVSQKVDEDIDGFLITCFSDLYYGSFISDEYLQKVFETINSFQPDLILFEGDLIDQSVELSEEKKLFLIKELSSLNAKYGKYAVLGDQDLLKSQEIQDILGSCGFVVLNNENRLISIDRNSYVNLVGIDSFSGGSPDLTAAFSSVNSNYFTFVISHCPDIFDSVLGYSTDFLSCGHSRGGQVYIPVISDFTREYGCKKYFRGKITRNGTTLQINNGVGRSSSDARFLADAQIILYTRKKS